MKSQYSFRSVLASAITLTVVAHVLVGCATGSTTTESPGNELAKTIRPLLGVNGGPTPFQPDLYPQFVDTTKQFQSLGVNAIRMVDYFGTNDIMCMFPDPSADPSEEANYELRARATGCTTVCH